MFIAPIELQTVPTNNSTSQELGNHRKQRPNRSTENTQTQPNHRSRNNSDPPQVAQPSVSNDAPIAESQTTNNDKPAKQKSAHEPAKATELKATERTPNVSTLNTISAQIAEMEKNKTAASKKEHNSGSKQDLESLVPTSEKLPVLIQVPEVKETETKPTPAVVSSMADNENAAVDIENNPSEQEISTSAIESMLTKIRSKQKESNKDQPTPDEATAVAEKPNLAAPAYTNVSSPKDVLSSTSDSFDSLSDYINQAQTENQPPMQTPEPSKEFNLGGNTPAVTNDASANKNITPIQVPLVDPAKTMPDPFQSKSHETLGGDSLPTTPTSWSNKGETAATTEAAVQSIVSTDEIAKLESGGSVSTSNAVIDNRFAEANDLNIAEIEPPSVDFSSLRIGGLDSLTSTENISQSEQVESTNDSNTVTTNQPIETNESSNVKDEANKPSHKTHQSTGLPLDTSIQNSSENIGDESDPKIGVKPENRPTATTVDLRMLKEQLSGKAKKKSSVSTLSDALSKGEAKVPVDEEKIEVVDQSISDLANSIRNMCERKNDTGPAKS